MTALHERPDPQHGADAPTPPSGSAPADTSEAPAALSERIGVPRFDAVSVTVLFLAFAYLIPARYTFSPIGAAGRAGVLLGLAMLFWWCVTRAVPSMAHRTGNPVRRAALIFFVVFLMAYAGGLARALPFLEANGMDRALLITASLVGVTLVVTDGVPDRGRLDHLLRRLVLLGSVMAAFGHIQFFLGTNLTENIRLPGMSLNREFFEVEARNAFTRVNATATHPIEFGVLMGMLLPLALHYALHPPSARARLPYWAMVGLIATAGPMSVSRSSVVAIGAGLLVVAMGWSRRQRRIALAISVPAVLAFSSAVPGLLGTIRGLFTSWNSDSSIQYRTNDYDLVFEFVAERPLFGRGPGTFLPSRYFVLDNQYLMTLVTTGIIGFLGLMLFAGTAALTAYRIRRRSTDPATRHLALALLGAFAAAAAASATYDSLALSYSIFSSVLFVLLGAVGALWRIEQPNLRPRHRRPRAPATP
ncbi:MAG: O-antigen ligase family protein [Actinomycetota bacterium]